MSHITLAQQGLKDAEARNHPEAITKLSAALLTSPNPTWLLARSKSYIATGDFSSALLDADKAWHSAWSRNKRPLMQEAQYRRAVALRRLGRFADADCCCIYSMRLAKDFPATEKSDPKGGFVDEAGLWTQTLEDAKREGREDSFNSSGGDAATGGKMPDQTEKMRAWRMASTMRMQILQALDQLPEDDPARKVTVSQKPEERELAKPKETPAPTAPTTAEKPKGVASINPALIGQPPRMSEFQSTTNMSVSIFSKGNSKDELRVTFSPRSISLKPLVHPDGEKREYTLDVWGDIDTQTSTYVVTPNKVELNLKKSTPGKWAQLKAEEGQTSKPAVQPTQPTPASEPTPAPAPSKGPTSFSKWDSNPIDDKDVEEEESDVNGFFKKLYKGATPEQQRAMIKSFTESSGTSLSTNWEDVREGKVTPVPPEGVEAKKWEEK